MSLCVCADLSQWIRWDGSYHPDLKHVGWEGTHVTLLRKTLMTLPAVILQQQKPYVYLYVNMPKRNS